jgi:uncharacterized OB-fold protein
VSDLPRPKLYLDDENRPFWEATERGELKVPRCDDCNFYIFYPRERCPACRSERVTWTACSGRGSVYSFTVTRRIPGRFREHTPFVLAYVELEEGPRMMTNIVDCDPDQVRIGMPVVVSFDPTEEGPAIPRFRPA